MHGVLEWQCKKMLKYSLRSSLQHGKLGDNFLHKLKVYWPKPSKIFAFFSLISFKIQYIFCMVWPGVNRGLADIILFGIFFVMSTKSRKPVTCTRSITFVLLLKGILNIYMNRAVFPAKCIQFMDASLVKKIVVFWFSNSLASFEISNQNHHHQTGYNCNVLTRIINNLFGRNTMRLHGTPKIWGLNNSHGLFWDGRTDANYIIVNIW